jgi:RNA recognition motif-containing protein
MNIYVGNMNFNFKDEDLSNLFTPYGNVGSAKIIIDRESGRSKGFGFVEMENDEEALNAIAALHETEVMGRKLVVNQARPQEKKSGGGFGNRSRSPRGGESRNW